MKFGCKGKKNYYTTKECEFYLSKNSSSVRGAGLLCSLFAAECREVAPLTRLLNRGLGERFCRVEDVIDTLLQTFMELGFALAGKVCDTGSCFFAGGTDGEQWRRNFHGVVRAGQLDIHQGRGNGRSCARCRVLACWLLCCV